MIPGWEGTATSLCVSLSTSSVKLEIKPGLVFFDNSHQKSQTQALQGPASTQATRKALPPCLSSPLPWAKLSLPTAPYPADWDQEWRPPRWRESGIPEPSPDSRSAEILAAPAASPSLFDAELSTREERNRWEKLVETIILHELEVSDE